MTVNDAVAKRISNLLVQKNMTQYKLEQKSGILHGTMMCIINERNKNITLKTIFQLARGFDMSFLEFLDDKLFTNEELDID